MPNLDIYSSIAQPTQLNEKAFKLFLQGQVGVIITRLPLWFGVQFDRLNDARLWFIARQPAANPKTLDGTKTQGFND